MTRHRRGWKVIVSRDIDVELRTLHQRFVDFERRHLPMGRSYRPSHRLRSWVLPALGLLVALLSPFSFSPFSPMDTLRHIAASPNCTAARAVGLAPARRDEPGYYSRHDADNDGIACEPWPR